MFETRFEFHNQSSKSTFLFCILLKSSIFSNKFIIKKFTLILIIISKLILHNFILLLQKKFIGNNLHNYHKKLNIETYSYHIFQINILIFFDSFIYYKQKEPFFKQI